MKIKPALSKKQSLTFLKRGLKAVKKYKSELSKFGKIAKKKDKTSNFSELEERALQLYDSIFKFILRKDPSKASPKTHVLFQVILGLCVIFVAEKVQSWVKKATNKKISTANIVKRALVSGPATSLEAGTIYVFTIAEVKYDLCKVKSKVAGFVVGVAVSLLIAYIALTLDTATSIIDLFSFGTFTKKETKKQIKGLYVVSPIIGYTIYRLVKKLEEKACEALKNDEIERAMLINWAELYVVVRTIYHAIIDYT